MTYQVQTYTLCDGWINTWSEDDQPMTFDTLEEAQIALQDHLEDLAHAVMFGMMVDSTSDYRIEEITA
jgi:hypothetical protein